MRLDTLLVERGFAGSRSLARRLIEDGAVSLREDSGLRELRRPAEDFDAQAPIIVAESALTRYVSRGGLKLEAALRAARISVVDLDCLDIGQSTGGFTDCLLRHGARSVTGVDVGHSQLAPSLREDPRVKCLEGINIRHLEAQHLAQLNAPLQFACIVIDVSFISLAHVLGVATRFATSGTLLLALVKPQFEAGLAHVGKGGIVRSEAVHRAVLTQVHGFAQDAGWQVHASFESALSGGDGNREFFIQASL